ncbi:MAG TPA: hypothetical protein PKC21_10060 [Oligoflexia bacterium]|nr:hypothetical protein [Oligoflexia bacterium]HMR25684.1 hypothetical protein [Oligoflexia bacterium]
MKKITFLCSVYFIFFAISAYAQTSSSVIVLNKENSEDAQLSVKFINKNVDYVKALDELFELKRDRIFRKTVASWEIKTSGSKTCKTNEKLGWVCWQHFVLTLSDQLSDDSHDFVIEVLDNRSNGSLSLNFEPKALDFFCSKVIGDYVQLTHDQRYIHLIYDIALYRGKAVQAD